MSLILVIFGTLLYLLTIILCMTFKLFAFVELITTTIYLFPIYLYTKNKKQWVGLNFILTAVFLAIRYLICNAVVDKVGVDYSILNQICGMLMCANAVTWVAIVVAYENSWISHHIIDWDGTIEKLSPIYRHRTIIASCITTSIINCIIAGVHYGNKIYLRFYILFIIIILLTAIAQTMLLTLVIKKKVKELKENGSSE